MTPWTVTAEGLMLAVRVTPKSSRDGIDGIVEDADGKLWLKIRLTAAPEDGKANQALLRLLARMFRIPKSSLDILSGESARSKRVLLRGDGNQLAAVVAATLLI
ncbi:DUF167 domain-containing protein [Govanella unica]|uniref:UPF0235 protein NYP16_01535 n=1 Tax=Govanella unica TaxID=2975056 RepID=A0A9X3TVU3_9PROT|nr:DUF167 family protein [Govania unica]MDA5192641.1 DUF167 family protein [Govania unica]